MKNFILLLFLSVSQWAAGQTYDIVIKGGHVIDAKNKIDKPMDIAINDGKIAKVAASIDAASKSTSNRV